MTTLIIGPTSSGKTSLSLWLAEQLGNTDILVVDSKQVYRGQDIVTGKDLPENFQFSIFNSQLQGFKRVQVDGAEIRLFGVDIVNPDEEWSVAHFLRYAKDVIENSRREGRQLIIVGGTPQFTLSLFDQPESAVVPPDVELRKQLEKLSVEQLQHEVPVDRLTAMNESDRRNPRRLIRAVEISRGKGRGARGKEDSLFNKENVLWIGLSVGKEILADRIHRRVIDRMEHGAVEEYKRLRDKYPHWTKEAKASIGYSEIEAFLSGTYSEEELIKLWSLHEIQYARRQLQWWKRESQIKWFDALDPDLKSRVHQQVKD